MTSPKQRARHLVGQRVRSHFKAPWTGTVESVSEMFDHCVVVLVDTDRCGRPMKKPVRKHLSVDWLEKLT